MGCTKVSDGCKFCYAENLMDTRWGKVNWGPKGPRVRTADSNWQQPFKWDRAAEKAGERHRVFCASLADVFEDRPELTAWRKELLELIERTTSLDWLILTKRPESIRGLIGRAITLNERSGDDAIRVGDRWLGNRCNVWLGTSVENQETADERIPHVLRCPAAVRFLSCEPLLGPIDLGDSMDDETYGMEGGDGPCPSINWVIIGGESGPGARPMDVDWARQIVRQCKAAGVAIFCKQLGSVWARELGSSDSKGGAPQDWPQEINLRQFPIHPGYNERAGRNVISTPTRP